MGERRVVVEDVGYGKRDVVIVDGEIKEKGREVDTDGGTTGER